MKKTNITCADVEKNLGPYLHAEMAPEVVDAYRQHVEDCAKCQALQKHVIPVSCYEVYQQISNYIDNDVDPETRERMTAHFKVCQHCSAVHDGTRNVLRLVGDEHAFEVPSSFGKRLFAKLDKELHKH